jgi:hypothetical protein
MMYLVLPNSFRLARYLAPVALLAFVPLAAPGASRRRYMARTPEGWNR